MKIGRILWLCAAVALPASALAETPFSSEALGTMQGIMDYCARINPGAAAKFKEQSAQLVQGVSREDLDKLRSSDEYKQAYEHVGTAQDDTARKAAEDACSSFLQSAK